jgi:peptide/nickel transport system permease protein
MKTHPARVAAFVLILAVGLALAVPALAPHDPFETASLDLINSLLPPAFMPNGDPAFPFGTDGQGRDMLSAVLYGARLSFSVGALALLLSAAIGVPVGLLAGAMGGVLDTLLMRLADAQLAVPPMLLALLLDGAARALLPPERVPELAVPVLIGAIGIGHWPQFARVVYTAARLAAAQDYVAAAQLLGRPARRILFAHVAPNAVGPALVLAPLLLGMAVIDEATLSFLGVGLPATQPSLGTLVRMGTDYLLSGQWWVALIPAAALAIPLLVLNGLGDALRDRLAPELR